MMGKRRARRQLRERAAMAAAELGELESSIQAAYSVFNHTADMELVVASILELSALQSRYTMVLRELKTLSERGEEETQRARRKRSWVRKK